MYISGALCLWLLRAWKVGNIDSSDRIEDSSPSSSFKEVASRRSSSKSSFLKRMVLLKRV